MDIDLIKQAYILHSQLPIFKWHVKKSLETIALFLKKYPNSYISWSAGKDSTAMMHLILRINSGIKIMTEKDDMDFPEEMDYVIMMKDKYNLDLDIINPDVNLWDIIQNYDITEDIHSRSTAFSQKYFYSLIQEYKQSHDFQGVFLGLRSEESKGRKMNRRQKGLIYEKKDGEIICQPIADWTAKDVFAYLFSNEIPIMDVYFKTKYVKSPEQIRKSWILPSAQANQGQAVWLKYYYPDIFYKLAKINPELMRYA